VNTRQAQRIIVGLLVVAAVGAAVAAHVVSTQGLHHRRVDRIQSARQRVADAVERRTYFLEDLADMVGVHDDAAAAEFARYAHVRGRDERAVVSVQWVRKSPTGRLVPPADGDPNPGATPILIAPAERGNISLANAAHEQTARRAVQSASLQKTTYISAPVTLASGHRGFYLAVPVQAHRYSGSLSKAESQSAIVGLIDAQTLAADALGGGTRAFQLRDRLTPLASVGSGLPNALRAAVPVAGRQWTVAVAGGSLSALEIALPWLILAFGFALAAGVAVLLGTAARRRDEALRLAAERLAELEVSLQRVELTNRDLEAAHAEAELRSRVDALTEVFNRRHFGEVLGEELARAGGNTAVLLLDIDHFKQINDGHGHLTGDVILRAVARRTGATLRDTDCLARWGGEEFVILTHVLDREEMLELAERVRRTIADDPVVVDGTPFELRVSIGAVLAGEGIETPDAIIRAADDALYEAKRAGRDRVCLR
jgi:diguanylate cyclase (GGDEF)-like protein